MKSITITHPASIRLLTDATWDFARVTLWKRFPFYEREIEIHKNYIREYYENIPAESFAETARKYFIGYCARIVLLKMIDKINSHNKPNLHAMEPLFLTNLNENEFKELLKATIKEVLNENYKASESHLPQILDVKQAAEFLHLEVTTIYEKTCRKLIPHFKKGNKLYFNLTKLESWIEQGKVQTSDEIGVEAANYLLRHRRHGNY